MSGDAIKQKAEEIEKIYREYMEDINKLKAEQNRLLDNFAKKLEEEKKKEIMSKINAEC